MIGTGCTIVSMLPYELNEVKPQIQPGAFLMPPAARGDFNILTIERAERPFYVDYQRGNIMIPEDPEVVAKSVVNDHIKATVNVTDGAHPGLFYINGLKTKDQIKKENSTELLACGKVQDAWFSRLVKAADDVWQRFRRHNTISDQHRFACKMLGLKREWAEELKAENTIQCMYCTSLISAKALVCPTCRLPQLDAINALDPKTRDIILKTLPVPGA